MTQITFTGDYASFEEARRACGADCGYSGAPAIDRYVRRFGEVRGDPLGTFRAATEQVLRFMAVFSLARPIDGTIEVLDHGGGYGAIYEIFRALYPNTPLRWTIVELPALVARADEMGACENKLFRCEIPDQEWSLAITSGALQYFPSPETTWREIEHLRAPLVFVNRFPLTPFLLRDRLVVESVPPSLFDAKIPVWFFAPEWAAKLTTSRKLLARWDAPGDATTLDAQRLHYQAFLLGDHENT